ncbi:6-hydroxynicotinate 3-monooxygenase [Cercospora beticola]|nr:6-hydroxynicotinate 3-monooxygenase [Cercospora beticola]PIB00779.1 6-hydroxynicotinate 3-monooxygenase [Cercospora beticola]
MAQAGCQVTILEAAEQLGEIGAGIQMTPNASRLLIRYGVHEAIGDNLVPFTELNLRKKNGEKVGYTLIKRVEEALGYPWWLVHRHHLHTGLVKVARRNGVRILVGSRVRDLIQGPEGSVNVATTTGKTYAFDLVVGADGVQSVVRKTLFLHVRPCPPTGNCAYRAIVPYDEVRCDPLTRSLVEDANGDSIKTMEVWMSPSGYIISYPISNCKDFNMVLSHFRKPSVDTVQEVSVEEVRNEYQGYDARIERVISMIKAPIARWPLLVTGPLESWSNSAKNVVLMGDAAHSMTNHMAQGAATSMEDGAFLARCLSHVVGGTLSLRDAIALYERGRMPKASYKQQLSYLNGWLWHLPDGAAAEARNRTMTCELDGQVPIRSANLYGDPSTVLECYGYDAEEHADQVVEEYFNSAPIKCQATSVTQTEACRKANWFLPGKFQFTPKL